MAPIKKPRKTAPSPERLCGRIHLESKFACTRPFGDDHTIHVAVEVNSDLTSTGRVLAAWSDDLAPSMALNRAKVDLYRQITNMLAVASPFMESLIVLGQEEFAQRGGPKRERCCEKDIDGDGSCPAHSAPGIERHPIDWSKIGR